MGWLRRAKDFWRELRDLVALRTLPDDPRRLIVYAEDVASYNVFDGHLRTFCGPLARETHYVTSDPEDPVFQRASERIRPYFLRQFLPTFLRTLESGLLLMTAPDLGNFHVKRPAAGCRCVYVFHSINSVHEQYNEHAFDHYDDIFCVGPHHRRELEAVARVYGVSSPRLHDVGYPKLDRLNRAFQQFTQEHPSRQTVLLAPSWWKGNVLEAYGETIIERLLALGVRVIVRPHPLFFLRSYPGAPDVVDRLARKFEEHPDVEIERDIVSENAFFEADLMISDHSGAALEYALGTARPVLLFDVQRKTLNPHWERLGQPIFESEIRSQLGLAVSPDEAARTDVHVSDLLARADHYRESLQSLRETAVYHFGESGEVGARILAAMQDEEPTGGDN